MAKERISMPSGMGGLTRYFDEYKSKISLKPEHVLLLTGIIIIIVLFLHMKGYSLLGVPVQ